MQDIEKLRKRFRKLRRIQERRKLGIRQCTPPRYDEVYFQAIERMNSEEGKCPQKLEI